MPPFKASILLLLSLALSCSFGTRPREPETGTDSPQMFVQGFYDSYALLASKDTAGPSACLALGDNPSLFGRELLSALKDDCEAQARAEGTIVGLDFDPFLASQDPCAHYEVGEVTRVDGRNRVEVYGLCNGERGPRPDVVVELAPASGSWTFVNLHYPKIDDDLLSILRRLRKERRGSP